MFLADLVLKFLFFCSFHGLSDSLAVQLLQIYQVLAELWAIISMISKFIVFYFIITAISTRPLLTLTTNHQSNPETTRFRQALYNQNRKLVQQHNANPYKTYDLQLNDFAILSDIELKQLIFGLIPSTKSAIILAKKLAQVHSDDPKHRKLQVATFDNLKQIENNVLSSVTQFFKARNKSQEEITRNIESRKTFTIQQLVVLEQKHDQGNEAINNTRLLQQISLEPDDLHSYDVDWTCISGGVRSQGACGACYAIAAADCLSAIMSIYYYTFYPPLSVQQLLDCPRNFMSYGCDGGFLQGAFSYMITPGINSQFSYPYSKLSYESSVSGRCRTFPGSHPKFKIKDFINIQKGNCLQIKKRLQNHPVAIGISAKRMLLYKSGVFNGCDKTDHEDHAVLLIGFQSEKGWKIKNSWGDKWGENGYGWIADGNNCNICEMAFYPLPIHGSNKFKRKEKVKQCPMAR